ncbi:MAG: RNA-directed DNA polymerase (Reverse transcriptase) [Parcubacteria group bacterium GW2011_GWA2_50_10b]|nr:MAG: RNA-directed DNA polymerase (Reverse transcriptase) [Parcubacteria group bacterium GW2011_GWA2_50_10b]
MEDNRSHEISVGGGFNGSIFSHITSVENLFAAWREFKKGKSKKSDVVEFSLNLENNIFRLREELLSKSWKCGGYQKFIIKDPKPRIIHKATVPDRLLYQAVYRILYPIFDRTFIFDSYSSRNGKGTHAGIKRLNVFLRKLSHNYTRPVYALKCDIKKFFDSIDHGILLELIQEKVSCPETMQLLEKVIDSFHKIPGKGLPLGNVTSQIFANVYMNRFDWYVKKELKIKYYVRYCDDFVILSSDIGNLTKLILLLQKFLDKNLKLELHPDKILIRKFHQGIDFLGAVLLPHRIVVRTKTKRRMIKKSTKLLEEFQIGRLTKARLNQSISSYLGHLNHVKSRETNHSLHSIRAKMRRLP